MNSRQEGIKSRITEAEEQVSDMKDRMCGNHCHKTAYRNKGMKRNKDSLRDLWDNIKRSNICILGVPEGEERKDLRKYLKR